MSLIDIARDTLKEIPMADILRERLSLALDQSAAFERQVGELQSKVGGLDAQLERERADHKQTREELRRLKEEHEEEIRVFSTTEFRRGKRTGGVWMAFCPKCHLPAGQRKSDHFVFCSATCGWHGIWPGIPLASLISQMEVSRAA